MDLRRVVSPSCRTHPIRYSKNRSVPARMEVSLVPAAAPRPETQEEILAAALAARDDRDIPAEDASWVIVDSDGDRPAELAGLDGADLLPGGAVPGPGAPPGSPACPGPSRSGPDSTDGPGQPGPDSTYGPGQPGPDSTD